MTTCRLRKDCFPCVSTRLSFCEVPCLALLSCLACCDEQRSGYKRSGVPLMAPQRPRRTIFGFSRPFRVFRICWSRTLGIKPPHPSIKLPQLDAGRPRARPVGQQPQPNLQAEWAESRAWPPYGRGATPIVPFWGR